MPSPTLTDCEAAIGEPAKFWTGRCYEIACALAHLFPDHRPVYGHYIGKIAPGTYFAGWAHIGWVQHGWLQNDDTGEVIDPTRWVFEGTDPYLYVGDAADYDEGGNQVRAAFLGPCPAYEPPTDRMPDIEFVLMPPALAQVAWLVGVEGPTLEVPLTLSMRQASWLANQPPSVLGPHAAEIYRALISADMAANIPFDNRRKVLNDI